VHRHPWSIAGEDPIARENVRVVGDLAALRVAISSTTEWVLGRSTGKTFGTKVMSELAGQFQRLE
jgi:hypothetical protein